MKIHPKAKQALDAIESALRVETDDDLVLINRLRAARGQAPLTEADFAAFDADMCDPNAGPLTL